jgi:hypothetical protein
MSLAFEGLKLQSNELREYTYGFFANICIMLESEDYSPYLSYVIPPMIESIKIAETETKNNLDFLKTNTSKVVNKEEDFFKDEDDEEKYEEDFDDDEDNDYTQVRESVLDEKISAIEALGVIAENSQ